MDELQNFKPMRVDHPKDVETFTDMLDIAVINMKVKNRVE